MNIIDILTQKPETTIALSSVVIAFCALLVSLQQMAIQRKHNRLSVRPLLQSGRVSTTQFPFQWHIRNVGSGPAIVTKYRVTIGSQTMDFPSNKLLMSVLSSEGIKGYKGSYSFDSKSCMKAEEEIRLIEFDVSEVPNCLEKIERIYWEIEYQSLYDEKFSVSFTAKAA